MAEPLVSASLGPGGGGGLLTLDQASEYAMLQRKLVDARTRVRSLRNEVEGVRREIEDRSAETKSFQDERNNLLREIEESSITVDQRQAIAKKRIEQLEFEKKNILSRSVDLEKESDEVNFRLLRQRQEESKLIAKCGAMFDEEGRQKFARKLQYLQETESQLSQQLEEEEDEQNRAIEELPRAREFLSSLRDRYEVEKVILQEERSELEEKLVQQGEYIQKLLRDYFVSARCLYFLVLGRFYAAEDSLTKEYASHRSIFEMYQRFVLPAVEESIETLRSQRILPLKPRNSEDEIRVSYHISKIWVEQLFPVIEKYIGNELSKVEEELLEDELDPYADFFRTFRISAEETSQRLEEIGYLDGRLASLAGLDMILQQVVDEKSRELHRLAADVNRLRGEAERGPMTDTEFLDSLDLGV